MGEGTGVVERLDCILAAAGGHSLQIIPRRWLDSGLRGSLSDECDCARKDRFQRIGVSF